MIDTGSIQDFIWSLSEYRSENTFNPWSQTDEEMDMVPDAWINRQLNLLDHLKCDAKYILVGEAPGYQGCRYSGVPFTSERLLCEGSIPRLEYNKGIRITKRKLPWSEPSATIVWGALKEHEIDNETILWNAFPFHPHAHDKTLSNRTPSHNETREGWEHSKMLFDLFPDATVVAVGNTAYKSITENWNKAVTKVTHPANGGATKFRNGLAQLVK